MRWFWFPLGALSAAAVLFAVRMPKLGTLVGTIGLIALWDAFHRYN